MLQVKELDFQYDGSAKKLLDKVGFEVGKNQKIGVVGANGSGKSTLLRLVLGELSPGSGEIIFSPPSLRLGYLPQYFDFQFDGTLWQWLLGQFPEIERLQRQLRDLERQMAEDSSPALLDRYSQMVQEFESRAGYHLEHRIAGILDQMGFDQDDWATPYRSLSSGQRQRAAFCVLFLGDYDLLLVDEPTNHLDLEAIQRLENYLRQNDLTVIMVTHDRALLDNTVARILELERGHIHSYSGNYSDYRRQKAENEALAWARYNQQQKTLRQLAREERQRTNWAEKCESGKTGDGHVDRGYIGHKAAKMMQRAKNAANRHRQLLEKHNAPQPYQRQSVYARFSSMARPGNFVVELSQVAKAYGSKLLFSGLDLRIDIGERIALSGPNGCGKSTLLKLILGSEPVERGRIELSQATKIGYCSQNRDNLAGELSPATAVREATGQTETLCRTVLGILGINGANAERSLASLSLGERTKVELTILLLSEANLLLLDEPTNHLDMPAREALEQSLLQYSGAMLFVSHDRYFVRKLATRSLRLG